MTETRTSLSSTAFSRQRRILLGYAAASVGALACGSAGRAGGSWQAYANSAACSATRIALITGRYQ